MLENNYLHKTHVLCYQILYAAVVLAMADQQLTKEEGDPLTPSHPLLPSTGQYAAHDDTELEENSYIVIGDINLDTCLCTPHSSTPCSVRNGENMYKEVSKMWNME